MTRITQKQLGIIANEARKVLIELPQQARLPGCDRDLTEREKINLAYVQAVTLVLNRAGAFRPGYVQENEIELESPDSQPMAEDADWENEDIAK